MLERVTRPAFKARGFAVAAVLNQWAEIIGPQWAHATMPEQLARDGTLTVRVAGPLATELKHLEPEILARIATYFGHRAVTRLRLVQGPLLRRQIPKPPDLRPLAPEEEQALANLVAPIAHPELRESLEKLGRVLRQRQPPT
jgi:hypothetical protein